MSGRPRKLKTAPRRIVSWLSGVLLLGAIFGGVTDPAGAGSALDIGPVSVRLTGDPAPHQGTSLLGIEFRLQPGWATYWRDPGEAGIAPVFHWSGSKNLTRAQVLWPAPERLNEGGFASFGYRGRVVLPVLITPGRADRPVIPHLALDFAVCGKVCVPKHAVLALDPGAIGPEARASIAPYLDRVPRPRRNDLTASIRFQPDRLTVSLKAAPPLAPGDRLDLIAEGPDGALAAAPGLWRAADGSRAELWLTPAGGAKLPRRLSLTVIAGTRALSLVAGQGEER